jgi:hypothetical protein
MSNEVARSILENILLPLQNTLAHHVVVFCDLVFEQPAINFAVSKKKRKEKEKDRKDVLTCQVQS